MKNSNTNDAKMQTLLDGAMIAFCKYGYKATSFDCIAECSNCSRTLLYYYFKDKTNLFKAVANNVKVILLTPTLNIARQHDMTVIEKLTDITQTFLSQINHSDMLYYCLFFSTVLLQTATENDEISEFLQNNLKESQKHSLTDLLEELFTNGISMGYFFSKNARGLATLYISIIMGLAQQGLTRVDESFLLPQANTIVKMFLK